MSSRKSAMKKVLPTKLVTDAKRHTFTKTWCRGWPCGPMDKAPDYGSGDSRFESWHGRRQPTFFFFFFFFFAKFNHSSCARKKTWTTTNEKPTFCLSTTSKLFFAVTAFRKAQRGLQTKHLVEILFFFSLIRNDPDKSEFTKHLVVSERDWANLQHRCLRTVGSVRGSKQKILVFENNERPLTSHMV